MYLETGHGKTDIINERCRNSFFVTLFLPKGLELGSRMVQMDCTSELDDA